MQTAIRPNNTVLHQHQQRGAARCGLAGVDVSALTTRADHPRFRLERHAEALLHRVRRLRRASVEQLRAGGVAVVDQHQRVRCGDAGIAVAIALPAGLLDQPGRRQLARAGVVAAEHRQRRVLRLQRVGLRDRHIGFLKKLPALPISAGFGSLRLRMRLIASATMRGCRRVDAHRGQFLADAGVVEFQRVRCRDRRNSTAVTPSDRARA